MMRLLPRLDGTNEFFWTSGREGVLRILRCGGCRYWLHPPSPRCPECGGTDLSPEAVSGRGIVVSYTINHQPWDGGDVPYVLAVVDLVEQPGLRLTTNIVGSDLDRIDIGLEVSVIFEDHDPVFLPLFEPAERD